MQLFAKESNMKITKQQLKQIIKEELEQTVLEEQEPKISSEDVEIGKALQNSPVGNYLFKQMDKNPDIQAAIQSIQQQMKEEVRPKDDIGGDSLGQATMLGAMGGMATVADPIRMAVFSGLLSGKSGLAIMGILKGAGLAATGIASGALAGYLIYKLGEKAIDAIK